MAMSRRLRLMPDVVLLVTEPYCFSMRNLRTDEEWSVSCVAGDGLIYKGVVGETGDLLRLVHARTRIDVYSTRDTVYRVCKIAPINILGTKTGRREPK